MLSFPYNFWSLEHYDVFVNQNKRAVLIEKRSFKTENKKFLKISVVLEKKLKDIMIIRKRRNISGTINVDYLSRLPGFLNGKIKIIK